MQKITAIMNAAITEYVYTEPMIITQARKMWAYNEIESLHSCQQCNLAVQQTNNQSEDQVVSDDEFIVEDPEPVPKPSLINCLEALVTLRSYFHYDGTEYDEDMELIEKVLRKKAEMKKQTAITNYFR